MYSKARNNNTSPAMALVEERAVGRNVRSTRESKRILEKRKMPSSFSFSSSSYSLSLSYCHCCHRSRSLFTLVFAVIICSMGQKVATSLLSISECVCMTGRIEKWQKITHREQ
jgi:hypothetical protein